MKLVSTPATKSTALSGGISISSMFGLQMIFRR
jgi:hypothetical protein